MSENIFCGLVEVHVQFRIRNFLDLPLKEDVQLQSPNFCLSDAKWYLQIFPYVLKNSSVQYIGLFLGRRPHIRDHHIIFKISIRKSDGSNLVDREGDHLFTLKEDTWGWFKFYDRNDLIKSKDTVAPDGSLTIFCTARTADNMEDISQIVQTDGMEILSENFKDLYISGSFSDVTIAVKGKEFPAHRNVLAARSKVFASMFMLDMKEKKTGKVEIEDCDPDSFEKFLLFLYTGKLDDVPSSHIVNIYKIADKYDLTELKAECARRVLITLSVDSFCDVSHLAFIYNEAELLTVAKKFFIENAKEILPTTKWKSFLVENPLLGNELFLKFVDNCE